MTIHKYVFQFTFFYSSLFICLMLGVLLVFISCVILYICMFINLKYFNTYSSIFLFYFITCCISRNSVEIQFLNLYAFTSIEFNDKWPVQAMFFSMLGSTKHTILTTTSVIKTFWNKMLWFWNKMNEAAILRLEISLFVNRHSLSTTTCNKHIAFVIPTPIPPPPWVSVLNLYST